MAKRVTIAPDKLSKSAKKSASPNGSNHAERERIFDLFRRWGFYEATLDPLGFFAPLKFSDLQGLSGEFVEEARRYYCGTIGVEINHLPEPERRRWIAERMEGPEFEVNQPKVLERLIRADLFEQVLQSRYLGSKRFSLEGNTSLIPLLDAILDAAGDLGGVDSVMAMSHRGRLNVMTHIACKPAHEVVAGFEDVDPRSVLGAGDVKYHVGATGAYTSSAGKKLNVHLVSNPSHLEAVDPVAMGRARAKQTRHGVQNAQINRSTEVLNKVWCVVMHGDAAYAGQGVLAETLNLADLAAYSVGGTIHIIVNNLIGFTTRPAQEHSSRFASSISRRQSIPIFHVNAEDPDAVVRIGRLAAEYRAHFNSDVVIDLIGYRRHGHSEVDDPTITQPRLYERIKAHPQLWKIYAEHTAIDAEPTAASIRKEYEEAQRKAGKLTKIPRLRKLPDYWAPYNYGKYNPAFEVDTGLSREKLAEITDGLIRPAGGFPRPPQNREIAGAAQRNGPRQALRGFWFCRTACFWLARSGRQSRATHGQDSQRGTFNQRHAILVDAQTEQEYLPLAHLSTNQAFCEIHNSSLSEAACLGFEYGFSRDYPEGLVLWEAQFGDFVNGAQIIIDQFISASEDKWGLPTGLVLLLPHGYEGQGPEHSSARIERFMQLAAEGNMNICQPSTAAQYFHLLRRQARRLWRKPLIVFTPKSMLRHPDASSTLEELERPRFLTLVPDREITDAQSILIASGKVGHELRAERRRRNDIDHRYLFPGSALPAA